MTIASEIANNNNLIVAVGNWARTRGIDRNQFHVFAIHCFERIAMLLVVNANELTICVHFTWLKIRT